MGVDRAVGQQAALRPTTPQPLTPQPKTGLDYDRCPAKTRRNGPGPQRQQKEQREQETC